MKLLTSAVLAANLLLCAVCQAQYYDTALTNQFTRTILSRVEPKKNKPDGRDTVSVVLLVSDTFHYSNYSPNLNKSNYFDKSGSITWVIAYSVRKIQYKNIDVSVDPNTSTYLGGGIYQTTLLGWTPQYEERPFYTHLEYLDGNKTPLSKSLVVWQSVSK